MAINNSSFLATELSFNITHSKKTGHSTMPHNHYHQHYEIYYLINGDRNYFIKNRTYSIIKGDLVLIDKNDLHKTIDGKIPDHERLLIDFTEEFLCTADISDKQLLLEPFKNNMSVFRLDPGKQGIIESILYRMLKEHQSQSKGSHIYIRALLMELLIIIHRFMDEHHEASLEYTDPLNERISRIVQYINEHYNEQINLNDLSDIFYISPFYLSRTFKRITGFSFVEYLNLIRIKEAQNLLRNSNLKVIEVVYKVGFSSVAHFGRVFKNITSLSPSDYKKRF